LIKKRKYKKREEMMKKKYCIIPGLAVILLLLSACESGGKLQIFNHCSYPAYIRVENMDQKTIPAGESVSYNIDTDTQNIFTGEVKKKLKIWMVGETYSIFDEGQNIYTDSTWIEVKAGKTYSIYLNPNRASVKIVNNSTQIITQAEIWQHSPLTYYQVGIMYNILPGESRFLRVDYGTDYYYQVELYLQDESHYTFVDGEEILGVDEQYLVTFNGE